MDFDFYVYAEQTLRSDLKAALEYMYEYGGTDMEMYDFYAQGAYRTLKELSMMVPIDEFAVLKKQYYCATYDGEWDDETEEN